MEQKKKIKIILGTLVSVLILIGFVLFKSFSIDSKSIMIYPMSYFKEFISISSGLGPSEAVFSSLTSPMFFIIPFLPIVIAFSVLVYYGVKFGEDKKFGMVCCLLPSFLGIILLGFSMMSMFLLIGITVCGILCTPISEIYSKELDKWKRYRTGSRTIGKCFFMLNLFLLAGLLLNVFVYIGEYNELYKVEARDIFIGAIPQMNMGDDNLLGNMDIISEEQKELIEDEYSKMTEEQQEIFISEIDRIFESGTMPHMISFFIFSIPFMVFGVLEMLRTILFSPVAGTITKFLLYDTRV